MKKGMRIKRVSKASVFLIQNAGDLSSVWRTHLRDVAQVQICRLPQLQWWFTFAHSPTPARAHRPNTHAYAREHKNTHIRTQRHTPTHSNVNTNVHMTYITYSHTHTHVRIYTQTQTITHTHNYADTHTHKQTKYPNPTKNAHTSVKEHAQNTQSNRCAHFLAIISLNSEQFIAH